MCLKRKMCDLGERNWSYPNSVVWRYNGKYYDFGERICGKWNQVFTSQLRRLIVEHRNLDRKLCPRYTELLVVND